MIDAYGKITSLDGSYAVVVMDETGCGRCQEPGGCGGANIGKMFCSTPRTFRVLNPAKSAVGTRVNIVIAEGVVRQSAVLAYGLPLLLLLAGAAVGMVVAEEAGSIIGAGCGLLSGLAVLHFAQLQNAASSRFQPYIRT